MHSIDRRTDSLSRVLPNECLSLTCVQCVQCFACLRNEPKANTKRKRDQKRSTTLFSYFQYIIWNSSDAKKREARVVLPQPMLGHCLGMVH